MDKINHMEFIIDNDPTCRSYKYTCRCDITLLHDASVEYNEFSAFEIVNLTTLSVNEVGLLGRYKVTRIN